MENQQTQEQVQQPVNRRGCGPKRKWTAADEQLLRDNWSFGCVRRLAQQLGRSKASVMQHAATLGLALWRREYCEPELLDFIRAQHAAGLIDTQIHRAWLAEHPDSTIKRERVAYVRRRFLKLPRNEDTLREVKRASYERQMEVLGVESLPQVWVRHLRRQAIRQGWPPDLGPLECRILNVMLDGQYRTRAEIAAALGLRPEAKTTWFKTSSGSQSGISNLLNRGLLRRSQRRMRKLGGKGSTCYEYWMPLDVIRSRPRQRMVV